MVDRYKAYQAIDKVKSGQIVLAFCWAHQRRDFLEMARSWPQEQGWALGWVARIGELYYLNGRRLELREDSEGFVQRDEDLRGAVDAMAAQAEAELAEADLHPARQRLLVEPGEPLDGPDGVRGAPRGADGQQRSGADGTWAGGGSEELLRVGGRLERSTGGAAVLAVGDVAAVGVEPAAVADGVPDGLRGGGG